MRMKLLVGSSCRGILRVLRSPPTNRSARWKSSSRCLTRTTRPWGHCAATTATSTLVSKNSKPSSLAPKPPKKRITAERDDFQLELDQVRNDTTVNDRVKKQFQRQLEECRAREQQNAEERDAAQSDVRQSQEKNLKLQNALEEIQEELAQERNTRRLLQEEYDSVIDNKNEKERGAFELQRAKKQLEQQVAELKSQLEELEDELQLAEDNTMRMEVTVQAMKKDHERELQHKDEDAEERRRALRTSLRDKEVELEEEQRQRQAANTARNKAEASLADLQAQLDQANKTKDDAIRQFKRLRAQTTELERENDEFRRNAEDSNHMGKEAANKVRGLEATIADLQEELVVATREKNAAVEEKRRGDQKVNELEEER